MICAFLIMNSELTILLVMIDPQCIDASVPGIMINTFLLSTYPYIGLNMMEHYDRTFGTIGNV